jgi:lambda family phage tail tape measure protein
VPDQINRIILQGVDQTGPATLSATRNMVGLSNTAQMSAKQMTAAMRGVPAQITDIVVSLASGQKPLTVLLQQGGQLKDMFGGVVPAAKALGASLLALVNPTTIIAGAAGALAIAYLQGAKESDELNRVLILTGNYAGQTAGSLNEMAKAISANGKVTRSEAVDALVQVIATGKVAHDQLQTVAQAAVDWAKVTGDSVKTVVSRFVELGDEPTKASAKLNEQYHFLTASVYAQIAALEQQGTKEQAAAVAQKALADAARERAKAVTENLGFLETAWNGVGKAASWAWDKMLGIGRDQTGAEQLTAKRQELAIRLQRGPMRPDDPASVRAFEAGNEALRKEIELMQRLGKAQADTAKQAGDAQRAQDAAISASERVRALEDQAKGIAAVDRELKKYRDDLAAIRKVDPNSPLLDPATVKRTEADIRKRFAGPVPEQSIDARIKQLQGALEAEERSTKMSLDRIRTDYDVGVLTTQQYLDREYEVRQAGLEREIAIAKKQEQLARGKSNIAAVEQYKNEQKKLQDQIEANFIQHNAQLEVLTAKRQRAVADYARSLSVELRDRQGSMDDTLAGAGLSARQQQEQQRLLDVRRDFERRREALDQARAKPEAEGGINQEVYDRELAALQGFYNARLAQEQDYNVRSQALREDWRVGFKAAFAEYVDSARDAASQSGRFFTTTLGGMEEALVRFQTTGKFGFREFATTIIGEIARINAKAAVSYLFGQGGGGGGLLEQIGAAIFGRSGGMSPFPDAGSFALPLTVAAKGNVFSARALRDYSNRIVDRPTLFAFAKGAGLMGEAGAEAVMPLRRGRDGRLGVDAAAASVNVSIANLGPPMEVVSQRRSGSDLQLVVQAAVQASRQAVARDIRGQPNSQISQALTGRGLRPGR